MVCIPCVLVPLLLFLWGMIKPMLRWFRTPIENAENQNNADDDQVCSLLSSCPCINKDEKLPSDKADVAKESETLQKTLHESSDTDKKNI